MIKRRFYKMEHGDKDDVSAQSSSSSSDSEIQPQPEHDPNSSSGEEPTLASDDDGDEGDSRPSDALVFGKRASRLQASSPADDLPEYVVKRKATFKCRICPKIVCLNEEAVNTHLKSKRHARSEKLLNKGQLKTVLNIDGKLDEEDTPALYARILAAPQPNPRKRSKQDDKRKPRKKNEVRNREEAEARKEKREKRMRKWMGVPQNARLPRGYKGFDFLLFE